MPTVGEIIRDLRGARIREKEKLDKLIVTLSAGTFVLSVTFITGIIDIGLSCIAVLFTSWGFLLLSIFSVLIALLIVDRHFVRAEDDVLSGKKYNGIWGRLAEWLTFGSVVFVMLGILLLGVFAAINILDYSRNTEEIRLYQDSSPPPEVFPKG